MKLQRGYGLDANGFIVSDVHIDKIDHVYVPCIEESIEGLKDLFQDELHSVYVYGSVARGDATIATSDLDLIAMFHEELSTKKLVALKELAKDLSEKYRKVVRDVGIAVASYKYTMNPENYYENAFLTEICCCVYGEDVGVKFGPYKLTAEIAISFNGDISDVLSRSLRRLQSSSHAEGKTLIQNFSRKLIRTFYSMVMVRSQIWTTRLREQAEVFLYYFPEKESIIQSLLDWIADPPKDRNKVYTLFKNEGAWASENFIRESRKFS